MTQRGAAPVRPLALPLTARLGAPLSGRTIRAGQPFSPLILAEFLAYFLAATNTIAREARLIDKSVNYWWK